MKYIMFTKHLEGLDVAGIMDALKSVGVEGADLCVRPGYPVNPENAEKQLPAAAKQFADEGLSIPACDDAHQFSGSRRPRCATGIRGMWGGRRRQSQGRLLALVEGRWRVLGIGRSHPRSPQRISSPLRETRRPHLPPQPFRDFDGVELIRRDEPR